MACNAEEVNEETLLHTYRKCGVKSVLNTIHRCSLTKEGALEWGEKVDGENLIHIAARSEFVKKTSSEPCSLCVAVHNNERPCFHWTKSAFLALITASNAPINHARKTDGWTPLHEAVWTKNIAAVVHTYLLFTSL